ncbi:glycosyltransferase family 87 protein [Planctomyces sp. SH-PL14]|uniref:glycosyltransferase family 87 protein n=1 Tax=Planctomyces sp. SH-PL14 TaxID=1632864 RepID=UPI00078C66B3|nr:glycosyltransferase family 87 protein [Planctomyces sp. SH-PL14]AMV18176.1 hypothetical protein VT03_09830 [Planctomyces sp. SH-PL14]
MTSAADPPVPATADRNALSKAALSVRGRLRLVLAIGLTGMLAAIAFHAFQGSVLHRGYPWNSFLWRADLKYTDFYDVLRSASLGDPYTIWSLYFPFTYVAFHPLSKLSWGWTLVVFDVISIVALWGWICQALTRATRSLPLAATGAAVILGTSYPLWLCIDRGNIEVGLVALVCWFLYFADRRRHTAALLCLLPAICLKLYPAALLGIYCRLGRIRYPLIAGAIFAVVTFASLASFQHSWQIDLALWQAQLSKFRNQYLIGDHGMGASASLWTPMKLAYMYGMLGYATWADQPLPDPRVLISHQHQMLKVYGYVMVALAGLVTWHVTIVETELRRKLMILLIYMVISAPGGVDYKLLHVTPILVWSICLSTRRPGDRLVTVLLALLTIPKKYWFFPYVVTDSGAMDSSIAVVVNPLLLLVSFVVLCWDGWRASTARTRQRNWKLATFAGFGKANSRPLTRQERRRKTRTAQSA